MASGSTTNSPNDDIRSGLALLAKAADFAARKHREQRRKDGTTPYVNHPIGVAFILSSIANVSDPTTLAAAYLHDTVEDTATTFEELEKEFGADVCGVVREVTDDKGLAKEEQRRQQVANAAKLSDRARLVRLADKLYNLRNCISTPVGWTEEGMRKYFEFGRNVLAQLRGTNAALEAQLEEVINGYFSKNA